MRYRFFLSSLLLLLIPATGFAQGDTQPTDGSKPPEPAISSTEAPDNRDRVLFAEETESFKPLVGKLIRNTILDQRDIWKSPFRINRDNAKWWILFGTATGGLIAADRHLASQLPNTNDQLAFSRRVSQVGAAYTVYPITAGFYIFGALTDEPKARETGALGLLAINDALIVSQVMKLAFRRERPMEGDLDGSFWAGGSSFPSGHAIMSWALASVIAHEYGGTKLGPIIAYSAAGLVSASRFTARKHYASDIIAGAAMGWFIGRYVFKTSVDHRIHERSRRELKSYLVPSLSPHIDPRTAGFGIALNWNIGDPAH